MGPNQQPSFPSAASGFGLPGLNPATISRLMLDAPRPGKGLAAVWLGCAAGYLALDRLFASPPAVTAGSLALAVAYSLGAGAALTGLVLLAVRRHHGFPFPQQPGEYLWVAFGLNVVFDWGVRAILLTPSPIDAIGPFASVTFSPQPEWLLAVLQSFLVIAFLIPAVVAVLLSFFPIMKVAMFLSAATYCSGAHWRTFFVVGCAVFALYLPLFCVEPRTWLSLYQLLELALGLVLAAVLLVDWRLRRRYPSTHWLGIGVTAWYMGVAVSALWANPLRF